MSKTLTFDIETVPIENLESYQYKEYKKVMKGLIRKFHNNENYTLTDLKSLRNLGRSVSPFLGKIVVIGLHYNDGLGTIQTDALYGEERTILKDFWKTLHKFGKGLFVSFNGLAFDVPFILKRSMKYRITPTSNAFLDLRRFSIWPHFDVKLVLGDWDRFATGNLDMITNFLNIPSPKEGKIAAKDVYQAYLDGRVEEIAEYCVKDVTATYEVYSILKDFVHNPFKNKKRG